MDLQIGGECAERPIDFSRYLPGEMNFARPAGFEPATPGLEGALSEQMMNIGLEGALSKAG